MEALALARLDLFLLVMGGTVYCSSSSEVGEEAESIGFFAFPLSIKLVCSGTLDLFFALASS